MFFLFTLTRSIIQPVCAYNDPLAEDKSPVTSESEKQRAAKEKKKDRTTTTMNEKE